MDQYSVYYMMKEALVYMEQASKQRLHHQHLLHRRHRLLRLSISYSAAKTAVISMSKNVGIQFA